MLKILVIEDDIALAKTLKKGLEIKSYLVENIYDGLEARIVDWNKYDLVLLDWNLPRVSGIELLRFKRSNKWLGSCIMLTAKDQLMEKVQGLDFGADDYIAKPFEWQELYSRINAVIRRRYGYSKQELGPIKYNKDDNSFSENDELIKLTETETKLLCLFFDYPNRVFTKGDIIEKLYYNKEIFPDSNVIERHISKLRNKFNYDPIKTIQNLGYRLRSHKPSPQI
jgi:DNA-binding response OmpR family regulator